MAKARLDPLLAALIAKLPAPGATWASDQQAAWLNLMAMAFAAVYGGEASSKLALPTVQPAKTPPPKPKPTYPFIIDEAGYVRNGNGKRILPSEVTDALFDLRGESGDLRLVTWADDSQGLNGRDLTIVAA